MILAINYADINYRKPQRYNSKSAKKYGADEIIEYSYESLPEWFKDENKQRFQYKRGNGYWVWKPFILLDALNRVDVGDYVFYTDSGAAFVSSMLPLIQTMENENTEIMCFAIDQIERKWSKRDALTILDCDIDEYLNTAQICSGYIIVKKSDYSVKIIEEWNSYITDMRIISDGPNVLGKDNYDCFIENRHDQTLLSLLLKKNGIKPFRDPSEWGNDKSKFSDEINGRSNYSQIIESHRNRDLSHWYQLNYKKWYKWFDPDRMLLFGLFRFLKRVKRKVKRIVFGS